jgi:ABC-type phosphate transport system substrate-binding protein
LRFHTLAIASIALLVHPDNPVDNISLEEARRIFSGEISVWSALGRGQNKRIHYPIHVIGRLHCKLRPGHWRLLLDNDDLFSPDLLEMGTIQDMLGSVSTDPLAIGYETLWMMQHHKRARDAKPLSLDGIRPDDRVALASGRYPLYRVYNITTWEGAAAKPLAQELVRYLQERMDQLDTMFAMVPASQLRRHGWKFIEDELVDEPD